MAFTMSANPGRSPRQLALAACLSLIFGVDHLASAATLVVTDCGDGSNSGTLRNTLAAANDGSTVQIPLACSRITLSQGHISIPSTITNLYITGAGAAATTIDAGADAAVYDAAFIIAGKGRVRFTGMTITGATYVGSNPTGGCIYSQGSVLLVDSAVTGCLLEPPSNATRNSKGAGIYAMGDVTLVHSTVSDNLAFAAANQTAYGAGVYAKNNVILNYSTVDNNVAGKGSGGKGSRGGGIFAAGGGDVFIGNSTISNNYATLDAALQAGSYGGPTGFTTTIQSSTVSGNTAGGIQTIGTYGITHVYNSTIAFNRANSSSTTSPVGLYSRQSIAMKSSIFANNIAKLGANDDVFSATAASPMTGSNNLIVATSNSGTPAGTLSACPLLGHLSNNGGPTQTIPLLQGSPALNVGLADGQVADQRGAGFARGVNGADIGAFERQANAADDAIFFSQFEGRCN